MNRKATVLILALALGAGSIALAGGSASAAKQRKDSAEGLYVLSAQSGELDRAKGKRAFRLLVRDPQGDVTTFTDRPERRAGHMKVGSFVRSWKRFGFKAVPPNAALVIADAPGSRDVLVVELSKPRLLRGGKLAFRAELLKGSATGSLHRFRKRADSRVAASFGEFSLFIDPSGLPNGVTFQLKNVNGLQGFAATFRNATLSGIGSSMSTTGAVEAIWSRDGFRITPRVTSYPSPGTPIDAGVSVLVNAQSTALSLRTEMPDGGTGKVVVSFKDPDGFDDCYAVAIGTGFRDLTLPIDGTSPPNVLPGC